MHLSAVRIQIAEEQDYRAIFGIGCNLASSQVRQDRRVPRAGTPPRTPRCAFLVDRHDSQRVDM